VSWSAYDGEYQSGEEDDIENDDGIDEDEDNLDDNNHRTKSAPPSVDSRAGKASGGEKWSPDNQGSAAARYGAYVARPIEIIVPSDAFAEKGAGGPRSGSKSSAKKARASASSAIKIEKDDGAAAALAADAVSGGAPSGRARTAAETIAAAALIDADRSLSASKPAGKHGSDSIAPFSPINYAASVIGRSMAVRSPPAAPSSASKQQSRQPPLPNSSEKRSSASPSILTRRSKKSAKGVGSPLPVRSLPSADYSRTPSAAAAAPAEPSTGRARCSAMFSAGPLGGESDFSSSIQFGTDNDGIAEGRVQGESADGKPISRISYVPNTAPHPSWNYKRPPAAATKRNADHEGDEKSPKRMKVDKVSSVR
jgi:hypothetical protein